MIIENREWKPSIISDEFPARDFHTCILGNYYSPNNNANANVNANNNNNNNNNNIPTVSTRIWLFGGKSNGYRNDVHTFSFGNYSQIVSAPS